MKTGAMSIYRICGVALVTASASSLPAYRYLVEDLGTLPGGTYSRAYSVNNSGHVVGHADNSAGQTRAFFWNGAFQVLAPDPSGDISPSQSAKNSVAFGINDNDQVVGFRDRYNNALGRSIDSAFRWNIQSGVVDSVPNFAGNLSYDGRAYGINNFGTVVGYATGRGGSTNWQPFRFTTNSGTVYMGSLTGDTSTHCYGLAINGQANICGSGITSVGATRSYRTNGMNLISIGGYPNDIPFSPDYDTFANDINDANTVVGYYRPTATTLRSFMKTANGNYIDLGMLSESVGNASALALAINNSSEIVGSIETNVGSPRATLLTPTINSWVDLNTRIAPNSGWTLEYARDISDNGYIVGYGKKNGATRAFLLTPYITVSGTISLEAWPSGIAPGTYIPFDVQESGTGQVLETLFVPVAADGSFSFMTTKIGNGRYIRAKHWHWLAKRSLSMNFTSDRTGVTLFLKNGDVDLDNEVGIGDYSVLSQAFGTWQGHPNFNVNADLNGDGDIDIADYSILSSNFGQIGDY